MTRSILTLIIVACVAAGLVLVASDLPRFGDATAPAHNEISQRYIQSARQDTGAVNSITAIVFDYRGYDTMAEATVLFVAATAAAAALAAGGRAAAGDHTEREPMGVDGDRG